MVRAAGPTVVLRSRGSQALAVAMVGVAVLAVVVAAIDGVDQVVAYGGPMVLFGLLGWAAFWQPHVEVSDGGVRVVNTWRTVLVPWPAVDEVEGRYGLRLLTAYGNVTAWAASPPAGRSRAKTANSPAADLVNERLAELRAAGYLDNPTLERPSLQVEWHRGLAATAAGLVLVSVVLPFLA
jgi:hypothetical protein